MAAGDRYKNGKPKDIVRHHIANMMAPVTCGIKKFGYATTDKDDVTCINCLNKLQKLNQKS